MDFFLSTHISVLIVVGTYSFEICSESFVMVGDDTHNSIVPLPVLILHEKKRVKDMGLSGESAQLLRKLALGTLPESSEGESQWE